MKEHELITSRQLIDRLKIHRMTLSKWVKKGLPKVDIGSRRMRFDYAAVLNWLDKGGAKK